MALNESFIAELKLESSLTRKILEKVPLEMKEWKPHAKSMTLGRLATHIAEVHRWTSEILSADAFDFNSRPFSSYTAPSPEELIKILTDYVDAGMHALSIAGDEEFEKSWTIKRGGQVLTSLVKKVAIRSWGFSHVYHHRGQLSVYLRMLDIPVPGMYGPSADER